MVIRIVVWNECKGLLEPRRRNDLLCAGRIVREQDHQRSGALLGVWFAFSEGDIDPVTAGVRFSAVGAAPGFLLGLIAVWRRRRHG
jgi:hypothetical protein